MNDSLLEKLSHVFVQQSVRNVCAKFKVYRLRCFCTGARHVLTTQKRFPGEIPLFMKSVKSNSP